MTEIIILGASGLISAMASIYLGLDVMKEINGGSFENFYWALLAPFFILIILKIVIYFNPVVFGYHFTFKDFIIFSSFLALGTLGMFCYFLYVFVHAYI